MEKRLDELTFLNFLRGMETATRALEIPGGSPFLNFLRGMETCGARPGNFSAGGLFLNFLRGMETELGCFAPFQVCTFLNFLRGMETLLSGGRGEATGGTS